MSHDSSVSIGSKRYKGLNFSRGSLIQGLNKRMKVNILNFEVKDIFMAHLAFSIGWHFLVISVLYTISSHYEQQESVVLGYIEISESRQKKLQRFIFFDIMSFPELLTSNNFYGTLSVFNRLPLFIEIISLLNLLTL